MQKLLMIASVAVVTLLSSCGSKQSDEAANTQDQSAAAQQTKQETIDSMNAANQQQKTIDSLQTVVAQKDESAGNTQHREPATSSVKHTRSVAEEPAATEQTATTTQEQKKGWSSTAKGAAIGAGAGALTGALVAKHKGAGALVGGLLGAGAGAGTGAIIDGKKKGNQ